MNRELILKNITIDNKFRPGYAKKSWYKKRNLEDIYNLIIKDTDFLPPDCSLKERIYCIKNNIDCPNLCIICNKNAKFNSSVLKYNITCSKSCFKQYRKDVTTGQKQSEETKQKRAKSLKGKNAGKNNGMYGKKPWNKGLTKNEDSRLVIKKECKQKLSKIMKEKIKNGEFTPNITNSWCRSKTSITINDKIYNFRSSWEATFFILNNHLKYEKIRIPYFYKKKEKIYIVDFVDEENKILYEIKPNSEREKEKNILKELAAKKWCKKNSYKYKIIGNEWFVENAIKIDYNCFPQIKKKMEQFLK